MKNKQLALRVLSTAAVMSILTSISAPAFADVYDLTRGDLSINVDAKNQQTVTQTNGTGGYVSDEKGEIKDRADDDVIVTTKDKDTQEIKTTDNTVTVNAQSSSVSANVTLRDVSIDASKEGKAALTLSKEGGGSVVLELDGNNTLVSGEGHAGIEKGNVGTKLIIQDEKNDDGSEKTDEKNDTGHLTATGGAGGAGIGGASKGATPHTRNINITGGDITANGGAGAAGIGGGQGGSMINTAAGTGVISGGKINATGGEGAAGIGGGKDSYLNTLVITGGADVTATGGQGGAGIGGGEGRWSIDVTIKDGSKVNATGNGGGAGIGGGNKNGAFGFVIQGDDTVVNATGNGGGAGIGGGNGGASGSGNSANKGKITDIQGGTVNAVSHGGGAGIGGGKGKSATNDIKISGGTVNAQSPDGGEGIGSGKGGPESKSVALENITSAEVSGTKTSPDGSTYAEIKYTTSTGSTYTSTQTVTEHREEPTCEAAGRVYHTVSYKDASGSTVTRTLDETVLPAAGHHWVLNAANDLQECSVCHKTMPVETNSPSLTVTGSALYQMTLENGCYLVTAPAQSASLTGTLAALKELRAQGVQVLVFRTQLCESRVSVAELLAQGTDSSTFVLTHTEGSATLTVDQKDCTSLLG